VKKRQPILAIRPWAERPLPDALRAMDWFESDDGHWVFQEGKPFADTVKRQTLGLRANLESKHADPLRGQVKSSLVGRGKTLAPGTEVTARDIEAILEAQGLGGRGLFCPATWSTSTGVGANAGKTRMWRRSPGLSYDGAEFLAEKLAVLVAVDNPFSEAIKSLAEDHSRTSSSVQRIGRRCKTSKT
jgi:Putative cyclase